MCVCVCDVWVTCVSGPALALSVSDTRENLQILRSFSLPQSLKLAQNYYDYDYK